MGRRGFFAELNHQAQLADKRRRQEHAQAVRAHNAAVREHERAQKAAERARAAAARADAAHLKAAQKEAERLHVEARTAEVDALNKDLAATYQDIDTILEWTLDTDDFVDLESLKVTATLPTFAPGDLADPLQTVPELTYPPSPEYTEPAAPKGLAGAFGGKKKHADAVAVARAEHESRVHHWNEDNERRYHDHLAALEAREKGEAERLTRLADAQVKFHAECARREHEATMQNEQLAKFINDLAFDVEDAISEYVGIVLSNSVYPDAFPVEHDYRFDLNSRELTLTAVVPDPADLPSVNEYRYVKAKDEIVSTQLTQKAQKDRYTSAVHQVAIRCMHEVFEADRAGKIHSIALTVGVNRIAPATGQPEFVPLVVAAADRETFGTFDLAHVVPAATLDHLGAAVSKSPFDLTPADAGRGVRQRGR